MKIRKLVSLDLEHLWQIRFPEREREREREREITGGRSLIFNVGSYLILNFERRI